MNLIHFFKLFVQLYYIKKIFLTNLFKVTTLIKGLAYSVGSKVSP